MLRGVTLTSQTVNTLPEKISVWASQKFVLTSGALKGSREMIRMAHVPVGFQTGDDCQRHLPLILPS